MKKYVTETNTLSSGSYLLTRDGDIIETVLHIPSTTYVNRGIEHLCPTDAEFLLNHGYISESDAKVILKYCLVEYLTNEYRRDSTYPISMFDITSFISYADLKYAPTLKRILMTTFNNIRNNVTSLEEVRFIDLNDKWYTWAKNNFVKVSVFRDVIEFRISSDDGYDWNDTIIDHGILGIGNSKNPKTRYTIVRESSKGYKAYFINATLDEILENDHAVLSSTLLRRYVVGGDLCYSKKI